MRKRVTSPFFEFRALHWYQSDLIMIWALHFRRFLAPASNSNYPEPSSWQPKPRSAGGKRVVCVCKQLTVLSGRTSANQLEYYGCELSLMGVALFTDS